MADNGDDDLVAAAANVFSVLNGKIKHEPRPIATQHFNHVTPSVSHRIEQCYVIQISRKKKTRTRTIMTHGQISCTNLLVGDLH